MVADEVIAIRAREIEIELQASLQVFAPDSGASIVETVQCMEYRELLRELDPSSENFVMPEKPEFVK